MQTQIHTIHPQARVCIYKKKIECSKEEFQELVERMPKKEEREKITLFGYTGPIPRTQKLFGEVDYGYSRLKLQADPIPNTLVTRCIEYAQELYPDYIFNGALVNLYEDG